MAGAGRLLCGESLGRFHLTDTHNVRVTGQGKLQKALLIVVLLGIVRKTGNGMDYIVDDISFGVLFHKVKFAAPIFNGEDSLFVGNGGENPAHQRSFTAAGRTSHADGQTEPENFGQKVQHFGGGCPVANEIIPAQLLGIHDTNGCSHTFFFVRERIAQNRDTDFIGEMAHHTRLTVIQNHAGLMKESANYINSVLWGLEPIFGGNHTPVRISDFHIFPRIDVNFLHIICEKIGRQEGELGHFRIEFVDQFLMAHALNAQTVIVEIRHIGYDAEVIRTQAPQKSILMFHDLIDDMLRAVFHQVSYILPHIQANRMRQVFFVRHALKLLVQPVFIHQETGDSDGLISLAAHFCYPPISISSCWPNSISKSNSISCSRSSGIMSSILSRIRSTDSRASLETS